MMNVYDVPLGDDLSKYPRVNAVDYESYYSTGVTDGGEVYLIKGYPQVNGIQLLCCNGTKKLLTPDDLVEDVCDSDTMYLRMGESGYIYSKEYCDDRLLRCGNCGRFFYSGYESEGVVTETGECYCASCVEDGFAYKCDECGCWHCEDHYENEGITGTDEWGEVIHICSQCIELYYTCDRCGCLVHQENAIVPEGGCSVFCPNCYGEDEDNKTLHSYHFDGDETDYGMPYLLDSRDDRTRDPLLGVESEMDQGGKNEDIISEIKGRLGDEYCVACEDGSLDNGFELISCPAVLGKHMDVLNWKDAFEYAIKNGYRSHDGGTCGLHVHIDREFFKNSKLSSTEIEGAMFIVLKNNIDWIKKFSRRFSYHYCQINGEDDGEVIKDMKKFDEKWNKKEVYNRRDRYKAINFSRRDTIEFRIFRGTLNIETFYATLQFVDIFARLVKWCDSLEKAMEIDLNSFVDYASHAYGYDEFIHYGKKIGIIDDNETGF